MKYRDVVFRIVCFILLIFSNLMAQETYINVLEPLSNRQLEDYKVYAPNFDVSTQLCFKQDNSSPMGPYIDCAQAFVSQINQGLLACGLRLVKPFYQPITPADLLIINARGIVLAHFKYKRLQDSDVFTYKNPNGTYPHDIVATPKYVKFVTPYTGIVAKAYEIVSLNGKEAMFRCGLEQLSGLEAEQQFEQCVQYNFVELILAQLCRFAF